MALQGPGPEPFKGSSGLLRARAQVLVGSPAGPLWAPWVLVGQALVGVLGLWAGPLWSPWAFVGCPGPLCAPWALMRQPLWTLWALMGPGPTGP